MVVEVISIVKEILGIAGNVADGIALTDGIKRLREVNLVSVYCDAFKYTFGDILPYTKELNQAESPTFDRDTFERELRYRALRIEMLPPIASGLNEYLMKQLIDILCHKDVILGADVSEQTARTIILASHSRYQEDALRLAPYLALQSQIIELNAYFQQQSSKIEQLMSQVANVLGNLENIVSQRQKDMLPIPKVYLPEVKTWAQLLALQRVDDSPFKPEYTFRDLTQEGIQSSVLIGKSGSGKT